MLKEACIFERFHDLNMLGMCCSTRLYSGSELGLKFLQFLFTNRGREKRGGEGERREREKRKGEGKEKEREGERTRGREERREKVQWIVVESN